MARDVVSSMLLVIVWIFVTGYCSSNESCGHIDEPLMLTPLLDKNDTETARRLSIVDKTFLEDFVPPSHAGYFTVDRTLGSHMFFWFFPSPTNSSAPLVVWLNGGPTISSMLGLFHENGPMALNKDATTGKPRYHKRQHSWVGSFSMLYIDNPIGSGFSYSESDRRHRDGSTSVEEEISSNLLNLLDQFLLVFPEYKNLEIYIGGQSYAGMYTISLAHYIHTRVNLGLTDVDIAGIYLGGPYFHPQTQLVNNVEFQYHLGGMSHKTYKAYEGLLDHFFENIHLFQLEHITERDVVTAFFSMSSGDNFVTGEIPPYRVVEAVMNTLDVKRAVHAGIHRKFRVWIAEVKKTFAHDMIKSRLEKLAVVMNNYKVLIFNGDLDSIISTASIEASLLEAPWKMQREYNESLRHSLYLETDYNHKTKGFFSHVGQFCRVIVCGAGHQTPHDKPEMSLRMMEDFVQHGCLRVKEDELTENRIDVAVMKSLEVLSEIGMTGSVGVNVGD